MLRKRSVFGLVAAIVSWMGACALGAEAATNALLSVKSAETNSPAKTNAATKPEPPKIDPVAEGKGFKITRAELDREIAHAEWQVFVNRGGKPILMEEKEEIARQVLEQLINVQLILPRATKNDRVEGGERAAKRLAEAKAKAGSPQAFAKQLESMHITEPELGAKWTNAMITDTVIKRELQIKVTDDDVKKFFNEHPNQFKAPEQVRIRMILIDTLDRKTRKPLTPDEQAAKLKVAQALLKRAQAGEDFAKLARENSNDPISRDKGGEYTFVRGGMISEVDDKAFTMSVGEISEVITSQYGYHIIKLEEKIPSRSMTFAEVQDDLKNGLVQDTIMQKYPIYITALKNEAEVKILDPRLVPTKGADPRSFLRPDKRVQPIK